MSERCGDVYDPSSRPPDTCVLPAGHGDWHSNGVGVYWEPLGDDA